MTNVKITPAEPTTRAEPWRIARATEAATTTREPTPAEQWYAIRSTPLTPKGSTR